MDLSESERVLSIQSHVASGYVGGKAAVFPLQLLGYDVDVVNTVNYSNHAGYGRTGGWKSSTEDLNSIFDVMEKNGLLSPSRLLTGYIPGAEALTSISQVVRRLRDRDEQLIYLLDPVMGDTGKLYVAADIVPLYREILPLATIITPNYFEVEVLTKIQLDSVSSLQKALRVLHLEYNVPHVVISSIPLSGSFHASLPAWLQSGGSADFGADEASTGEPLLCIASSRFSAEEHGALSTVHALHIPRIAGYFSGVGDLFSALVLAHFQRKPIPTASSESALSYAVSRSCQTTHAILWRTHLYSMTLAPEDRTLSDEELDAKDPDRKVRRMKGRELRLVKERDLILGKGFRTDEKALKNMQPWSGFWV